MSDLKLNRDISLDFCTPLALRLIWCKTFISIGLLVPHYSGPDGSAAQPALLKIVLHHVWFCTYSNNLDTDTCSLLYQHIYISEKYEKSPFYYNPRKTAYRHVTVSAFMYVRGWVFFGEIFFQTK